MYIQADYICSVPPRLVIKSSFPLEGGISLRFSARFLVRFCGNFYFKLQYCDFTPSGLQYVVNVSLIGSTIQNPIPSGG